MVNRERNRVLDFIRIVLASLVLLSHAYNLHAGSASREPLTRLTRGNVDFGLTAVDFFFLLSGSLIVASWVFDPRWLDFLKKRCLRIVPGYAVAAFLSIALCGLLAPGTSNFFSQLFHGIHLSYFVTSLITLSAPWTPPVFPGTSYPIVNGSMWTLSYEIRCYAFVLLCGVLGLLRSRRVWTIATVLSAVAFHLQDWMKLHHPQHLGWLIGAPESLCRFFLPFLLGGCYFLYRKEIVFRPWVAVLSSCCLSMCFYFHFDSEFALILFGGYLLFYLSRFYLPNAGVYARVPDISYGMYIYGWPIEKLSLWFLHTSPFATFIVSLIAAAAMGLLSWHFVERPMLRLKPRPSVQSLPGDPLA